MLCGMDTRPAVVACLRLFITLFNIMLGVYASILLVLSITIFLWLDFYISLSSDISLVMITILLGISGSIFCFSCLACCCMVRRHAPRILFHLYSVSIGSILLVQMVSILITFIFRGTISQALKEGIYLSMEKYGMETESSQAVDLLQAEVGCCGVSGPVDWQHTSWGKGHEDRLPHSCCHSTDTGICNIQTMGTVLYKSGCHGRLIHLAELHAFHLVSFLLVAAVIQGMAVGLSCCMARTKEDYLHIS
jgi:hypothetical protein